MAPGGGTRRAGAGPRGPAGENATSLYVASHTPPSSGLRARTLRSATVRIFGSEGGVDKDGQRLRRVVKQGLEDGRDLVCEVLRGGGTDRTRGRAVHEVRALRGAVRRGWATRWSASSTCTSSRWSSPPRHPLCSSTSTPRPRTARAPTPSTCSPPGPGRRTPRLRPLPPGPTDGRCEPLTALPRPGPLHDGARAHRAPIEAYVRERQIPEHEPTEG